MRSPASPKTSDLKRFFVQLPERFQNFPVNCTVLDADLAHYLRTVLRSKSGEQAIVVDEQRHFAYSAIITELQKQSITFEMLDALSTEENHLPPITLAVALIKEQRWDWLLQKTTELGVSAIQPLVTERTIVRLDEKDIPKKSERWQTVLRAAAEQSEGLFIPQLLKPQRLAEYLSLSTREPVKLLLKERGESRPALRDVLRNARSTSQPLVMAIGPEGGWTDAEITQLEQTGFQSVSLGQRILRAETAAIAAMAAAVYEFS